MLDVLFSASPYPLLLTTGVWFSLSQNLLPVVSHHKLLGFEIVHRRELHTLVHRNSVPLEEIQSYLFDCASPSQHNLWF